MTPYKCPVNCYTKVDRKKNMCESCRERARSLKREQRGAMTPEQRAVFNQVRRRRAETARLVREDRLYTIKQCQRRLQEIEKTNALV